MTEANSSAVVAELAAINRRLALNADSLELLFRGTEGDSPRSLADAMAAAGAAMTRANESVRPDAVWARSVEPSPDGPVVFLDLIGTAEQNRSWLTAFTEALTHDGWSGTVAPAPAPPSEATVGLDTAIRPAAYLGFRLAEEPPPGTVGRWGPPRWAVDTGTTTALCRYLATWAALPGAAVQLTMGRSRVEFSGGGIAEHLVWAAEHDHAAGIAYRAPGVVRRADLGVWGEATCQVGDDNPNWRERVEHLRAPLLQFADRLDTAFVRTGRYEVISWMDLGGAVPALPHVTEAKVHRNRRLWDRYVPDAHGIQVVTDAHLSRLGPLPGWDVRPLAGGRHLVQARDLEPWFASGEPDPAVVAAARADFADVLLTPEVIKAEG
ncbi:hypothetical protein AB0C12_33175 [Actinoplanes sp. NPDC048967]|uniref:hypothetical protein n=1 Tax=Actinoplanes sp. NPDC048967 TaxID=3155269 RepID=UPI0033EA313C